MDHNFSSPCLQRKNVTLGRDGKPITLVAQTVDIGFSSRQFSDPLHADEIVLSDGTLNFSFFRGAAIRRRPSPVAQYGVQ